MGQVYWKSLVDLPIDVVLSRHVIRQSVLGELQAVASRLNAESLKLLLMNISAWLAQRYY